PGDALVERDTDAAHAAAVSDLVTVVEVEREVVGVHVLVGALVDDELDPLVVREVVLEPVVEQPLVAVLGTGLDSPLLRCAPVVAVAAGDDQVVEVGGLQKASNASGESVSEPNQ